MDINIERATTTTAHYRLCQEIKTLKEKTHIAANALHANYGMQLERDRNILVDAWRDALSEFRLEVQSIAGGDTFTDEIITETTDYLGWMQWALFDLPYWSLPFNKSPEQLRSLARGPAFVFLAGRLLDDFIDRHMWCLERRGSALRKFAGEHPRGHDVDSIAVLLSILTVLQGQRNIATEIEHSGEASRILQRVFQFGQQALIGALIECDRSRRWTHESYTTMVHLKSSSYVEILFSGLDPTGTTKLRNYLRDLYIVDQRITDVGDFPRDLSIDQPNTVTIHLDDNTVKPDQSARPWPASLENSVGIELLDLARRSQSLEEVESAVVLTMLDRRIDEALSYGLFSIDSAERYQKPTTLNTATEKAPMTTTPTLEEVVSAFGATSIRSCLCPVCGSELSDPFLQIRGFHYVQCTTCSHGYARFQVRPDILEQLSTGRHRQASMTSPNEPFMTLCDRIPGPRVLVLPEAGSRLEIQLREKGFDVYVLSPQEAYRRITSESYGDLPWNDFHGVVVDRSLDKFPEPKLLLSGLTRVMQANGVLFVSTPDIESFQYRLSAENWQMLEPGVTLQCFSAQSLKKILHLSGWQDCWSLAGFDPTISTTHNDSACEAHNGYLYQLAQLSK